MKITQDVRDDATMLNEKESGTAKMSETFNAMRKQIDVGAAAPMKESSKVAPTGASVRAVACVAVALAWATVADAQPKEPLPCSSVASIGVATMTPDGVITLRTRSLPPGPIGEGTLRYPPDHPQYDEIRKHLGGIMPGESKPVPPWC